jgi:riboflavin synthase
MIAKGSLRALRFLANFAILYSFQNRDRALTDHRLGAGYWILGAGAGNGIFKYLAGMFTGIIECTGKVESVSENGSNLSFWVSSPFSGELKVDQSLSHDGVCLTVESVDGNRHQVTAIAETIAKTNLSTWAVGAEVNLERCMQMNGRLDGHIVQGHVDATAVCLERKELTGSWEYTFQFPAEFAVLVIEKGSIAVNGTSLTCFNVGKDQFTIAVIPYTFDHTNIKQVLKGSIVNIEFDILGKYIQRRMELGGS